MMHNQFRSISTLFYITLPVICGSIMLSFFLNVNDSLAQSTDQTLTGNDVTPYFMDPWLLSNNVMATPIPAKLETSAPWKTIELTPENWFFVAPGKPGEYQQASVIQTSDGVVSVLQKGTGFTGYISNIINTGTGAVYIEADVEVSSPQVSLGLAAINADDASYETLAGSFNCAIPLSARGFEQTGKLKQLITPEGGYLAVVIQAVLPNEAANPENVYVKFKEVRYVLGNDLSGDEWHSITDPGWIKPQQTPTPTFTNTATPTATIGTENTITIDLPRFPFGAKPLEMVMISAGTFTMGSPDTERGRDSNEGPIHQVTITKPFYLGKYEITQAQWTVVTGFNPATDSEQAQIYESLGAVGDDYPVLDVKWDDAQTFILWLNGMGLGTFRLPTEAEWEYACRAGTTTRYSFGDALDCDDTCEPCDILNQYMWWCGNSENQIHKVGLKLPNPWGLFDMHGNVEELCSDWYGPYSERYQWDPNGPISGTFRVVRGGVLDFASSQFYRSARRSLGVFGGIRLVRSYP